MHIEILKKTRLADNNRCGTLSIFTTGHSIEEIRALKDQAKIVCFGCDNNSIFYIDALRENGLMPDIITDNGLKETEYYLYDIPVMTPASLFETPERYYFIITLKDKANINQVRVQLLLNGVKNFAILSQDFTFDFDRCKLPDLKQAFFDSMNEIYQDVDFAENHFNEALYVYINPIKWWYDALEFVVGQYGYDKIESCPAGFSACGGLRQQHNSTERLQLLDVGPGAGLESLLYQKLLNCELNWINLKQVKDVYEISHDQGLISRFGIHVQSGYIEADDFTGQYDIIIFTDIIEHLAYNPVKTLKKLRAMLKPGGYMVISSPNRKTTKNYESWRALPEAKGNAIDVLRITNGGHVYEYTASELEELFSESGYHVVFKKQSGKLQYVLTKM